MDKKTSLHGFRASFRTWGAERTAFDPAMLEMALAHKVGSDVVLAYQRSDLLGRRFQLMQAWADHCFGEAGDELVQEMANVVTLRR